MNTLSQHYYNIINYDILIRLKLNNIFKISKLNKITLNIGLKNSNMEKKKMISIILLLKLIINQSIFNIKSKKNNIVFKIKKGDIIGCKVTLKKKIMYNFLEKLIFFILPNIKNFEGILISIKNINNLNFKIKNILNFFELEKEFLKFQKLPQIDITINTNNTYFNSLYIFLNQLNIPLKIKE
jgi:large subunit ribosomal protein L5